MLHGRIFNIQRYSIQDGPGIRTTVFFKGCPLRCAWCHNPEGLQSQLDLRLFVERCIRCGLCLAACPITANPDTSALPDHQPPPVDHPHCTLCGACVEACPTGAREIVGRDVTVAGLIDEILADRLFFDDSGGGVTFSGGEPFQQFHFLLDLLQACRDRGVHTAIDTSGLADPSSIMAAAAHADLFLYDLKLMDEARHREWTGASNHTILENVRLLTARGSQVWIRMPLIPGINDRPTDLEALAAFVASLPGPPPIRLLPYHKTALHKFRRLGLPYGIDAIVPPSTRQLEHAIAVFQGFGLQAGIGG